MIHVSPDLPQKTRDELGILHRRITPLAAAERMWARVLNPRERKKLGDDFVCAFEKLGTVRMWHTVRGGSPARAVIEVAYGIGFLDQPSRDWLIREIGERPPRRNETSNRPTWDRTKGELCFRGEVIRKVRVMGNPSNIQRILDAFQQLKWKHQISNPLPMDQQLLHQALRSLNETLSRIRFHATKGAQIITWDTL